MPRLRHSIQKSDGLWSSDGSEVLDWLSGQKELLYYLMILLRQGGLIFTTGDGFYEGDVNWEGVKRKWLKPFKPIPFKQKNGKKNNWISGRPSLHGLEDLLNVLRGSPEPMMPGEICKEMLAAHGASRATTYRLIKRSLNLFLLDRTEDGYTLSATPWKPSTSSSSPTTTSDHPASPLS